ncbi:hypothetical protein Tco_0457826 [Tanacetum coccineum]
MSRLKTSKTLFKSYGFSKLKKKNEDYEVLINSDLRQKEELKVLKKKIEGLEDEVKRKVNEIGEMKMVNDQCTKKISVYRNIFSDLDVKVLHLEKLGNELMGSGVRPAIWRFLSVTESSRLPPPPGFEEIVPKPKKLTKSKLLEIIVIDDDDDDEHDLINICSSKRKRVSG